jgi:hypothetical protein
MTRRIPIGIKTSPPADGGATTVILGMPPHLGAAGVDAVAQEIAVPLREALGA